MKHSIGPQPQHGRPLSLSCPNKFHWHTLQKSPNRHTQDHLEASGSSGSFPGQLETFRAIWRLSGTSEDFPVHLETFQSNMKLSRPYQNFSDHLETTCYPQEERNFHPIKQTGYLSKPLPGQNSVNTSKYQKLHTNLHIMCNRLHSVCISLHSECQVHIVCVKVHTVCVKDHTVCVKVHTVCIWTTLCVKVHTVCVKVHTVCLKDHTVCVKVHTVCIWTTQCVQKSTQGV